jgi:small subunit ribosomal protein S17
MDKTVVVEVERSYRHPLYGKTVHKYSKFMAHDASNACQIGDEVVLVESRPLSKNKRWVVQNILREDESARAVSLEEVAPIPGAVMEDNGDEDAISAEDTADDEA